MPVDKVINPGAAASLYANMSNIGGQKAAGGDEVSFSDFLKDKAAQFIDTIKNSERMSAKAVTGEADITDVVQATTAAELTLQAIVAVRDRLVGAYQEIMRMPI